MLFCRGVNEVDFQICKFFGVHLGCIRATACKIPIVYIVGAEIFQRLERGGDLGEVVLRGWEWSPFEY